MKWSLFLGRYWGIKVFIHWTFLILIGWVVISQSGNGLISTLWYIAFVLVIFACITFHEFGHALTAKKYGIKTKDIILLPIGGLARLEKLPENPKQELLVAIMGPVVNFVIASILLAFLFLADSIPEEMATTINQGNFVYMIMATNFLLGVFNLIPAFPMDGGRVLRAFLSFYKDRVSATRIAASVGQFLAIGFVFLGLVYNPFLILIGIFVYLGAQAEANFQQSRSLLEGHKVKEAIINKYFSLDHEDPISKAIKILLNTQAKDFIVFEEDKVVGTLNRREIIEALSKKGEDTKVSEIMNKDVKIVDAETPLQDIYMDTRNRKSRENLMPVMKNGDFVGVLDMENILEFIMVEGAKEKGKSVSV